MNSRILIVIPAYNAAKHLPELVSRLAGFHPRKDILVVNDGSEDNTSDIVKNIDCRYLSYSSNRGKGAAIRAGFEMAVKEGYDAALTLDADLQHLPEQLADLLANYSRADILVGTRTISPEKMPLGRILTNSMSSIIISIFNGRRVRDSQCGFRLIKTSVLRRLRLTSIKYDTESEMLFQGGYLGCSITEIPVATVYTDSRSFINPLLDTLRFIRMGWKRLWY